MERVHHQEAAPLQRQGAQGALQVADVHLATEKATRWTMEASWVIGLVVLGEGMETRSSGSRMVLMAVHPPAGLSYQLSTLCSHDQH